MVEEKRALGLVVREEGDPVRSLFFWALASIRAEQ